MRFLASTLTAAIVGGLIAGCSGNAAAPGTSGILPQSPSQSQQLALAHESVQPLPTMPPQSIYVANEINDSVTGYDPSGKGPLCTISGAISELSGPDAMAFDTGGNLYVANRKSSKVTVYHPAYQPCERKPIQTIGTSLAVSTPTAVAVTKAGFVYIANKGASLGSVTIYQYNTTVKRWGLVQTLNENIYNPQAMAFDSTGVLYVANGSTKQHPDGSVAVCTGGPPARQCSKNLASPVSPLPRIDNPRALAIDGNNDVFVANGVSSGYVSKYNSYALGNGFSSAIGKGYLNDPNALVFDLSGNLCASSGGNNEVICFGWQNNAYNIYKKLTAQNGIDHPDGLAVGPSSGWLKVANNFPGGLAVGTVTQYCPQQSCTTPTTIKNGIDGPVSIAIAP